MRRLNESGRLYVKGLCLLSFLCSCLFPSLLQGVAMGGAVGGGFPFSHTDKAKPGITAEGFFRQDPYEIRFEYIENDRMANYAVEAAIKHFFTASVARPYIEGAVGPVIVNTRAKGLAYGVKPEASAGLDLGINSNLSAGVALRYGGMIYFGSTLSGGWEAHHGMSLLGNVIVWF